MNRRGISLLAGLAIGLIVTIGVGLVTPVVPAHQPGRAPVNRAASLAFGKSSTCGEPLDLVEYTCAEHPSTCGVQADGDIDWSVAHADCWQAICDAETGVAMSHGETGTKDFYYCEREVAGCSSVNGGCPSNGVCITGDGRKLAIDDERTAALPEHGGRAFSCPYHDEG
jgi:hypothetical protein